MNDKANDTIDKASRFLELVNKHLKEKNCKHTIEVAKSLLIQTSNIELKE